MTIYIDSDYKCYVFDGDARRAFDVPFFDDKCEEFVQGYRYIPSGETWTSMYGQVFRGEMIAPWKPYDQLYKAQLEYEVAQYEAALSEIEVALGVTSK